MRVSATAHLSRFQPPSTSAVLLATYSAFSLRRASVAGRPGIFPNITAVRPHSEKARTL